MVAARMLGTPTDTIQTAFKKGDTATRVGFRTFKSVKRSFMTVMGQQ